MELGSLTAGLNLLKNIKHQAYYLSSLTEKIEKATEILEAKQHALLLSEKIEMLQQTVNQLVTENEQLKQALTQQDELELVQFKQDDDNYVTLYQATSPNGIIRHLCPCCYESQGKQITLQKRRAVSFATSSSATNKTAFLCHSCKTEFVVALNFQAN